MNITISTTKKISTATTEKARICLSPQQKKIGIQAPYSNVVYNRDYNELINKPSIENIELKGNVTFQQLNIIPIPKEEIDILLKEEVL